jgi:hypothetical protein
MKCDIFETNDPSVCVLIPSNTSLNVVPNDLRKKLRSEHSAKQITLEVGIAALNCEVAWSDLETKGCAAQKVRMRFSESVEPIE